MGEEAQPKDETPLEILADILDRRKHRGEGLQYYLMIVPYSQNRSDKVFHTKVGVDARNLEEAKEKALKEFRVGYPGDLLRDPDYPRIRVYRDKIREFDPSKDTKH